MIVIHYVAVKIYLFQIDNELNMSLFVLYADT